MRQLLLALLLTVSASAAMPEVHRDLFYTEAKHKLQSLDVYSPASGKDHPVIVWIHGGGWKARQVEAETEFLLGLADALCLTTDDVGSIAFPYAHIAGPDYLMMLLYRGCNSRTRASTCGAICLGEL